jgi:hypothetical protein
MSARRADRDENNGDGNQTDAKPPGKEAANPPGQPDFTLCVSSARVKQLRVLKA